MKTQNAKYFLSGFLWTSAIIIMLICAVHIATRQIVYTAPTPPKSILTARQTIWLNALEWCESKGNPSAINPRDRDNTPSYGLLQFKPSTYALYAKKIGLASTTDYMNPDGQKQIVENMIIDKDTNWLQQFPDCVKNKVGFPPKN